VEPPAADHPAAVAYPAFPDEVAEVVRAAAAAGLPWRPRAPATAPLRSRAAGGRRAAAHLGDERGPHRRRARRSGGRRRAVGRPGRGAGVHAWPRSTPRRPTSGWWATRSAAASAGTPDGTGLQCNAVTAPSSCSPTAPSCVRQRTTNPSCSGRSAVVAHPWVSSPRWSSAASLGERGRRLPRLGLDCGRGVLPAWVERGARGLRTKRRRRSAAEVPSTPESCRLEVHGRRLVIIDGAVLGDDAFAAGVLAPAARARPEVDTVAGCPQPRWSGCTSTPKGRPRLREQHPALGLPDDGDRRRRRHAGPGSGSSLDRHRAAPARRRACHARLRVVGSADLPRRGVPRSGPRPRVRPGDVAAAARGRRPVLGALEPWATGAPTCRCSTRAPTPARRSRPTSHDRLSAVRAAVDPHGLFLHQHAVPQQAGDRTSRSGASSPAASVRQVGARAVQHGASSTHRPGGTP
jgi:hypothetical protein